MKNKKVLIISSVILLTFLSYSCNKSKSDWKSVKQINSIESYNEYILKYPKSKFIDSAKYYIEVLSWDQTLKTNTIEEYKKYITEHPQSIFTDSATKKLEEQIWGSTLKANTLEAYQRFLIENLNSTFIDTAKKKIDQIIKIEKIEKTSDVLIIPFKKGFCSIDGPAFIGSKAGAALEFGPEIEYKGKAFQIQIPRSKDAYYVAPINVQFLTEMVEPLSPVKKLECNDQIWNKDRMTLDLFYGDNTIKIIVHIFTPVFGGFLIESIECFPPIK
ncbi:MAG: hypothetical protein MUO72_08515 [Bacteroidales bacterium]|nr:hypothetical protein [Bacteroidales bacterium]